MLTHPYNVFRVSALVLSVLSRTARYSHYAELLVNRSVNGTVPLLITGVCNGYLWLDNGNRMYVYMTLTSLLICVYYIKDGHICYMLLSPYPVGSVSYPMPHNPLLLSRTQGIPTSPLLSVTLYCQGSIYT